MRNPSYKEHGLSLVELMVGLAIGLIALLVMSQVLSVQSSQKQTTVSAADAQSSGGIALFTLERMIRMGGAGADDNGRLLGCDVVGYYQLESTAIDPVEFSFIPMEIRQGTGANAGTDSLTVAYAMPQGSLTPTTLVEPHDGSTMNYTVKNRFGMHLGDLLIIASPGAGDCAMVQVTSLPTDNGTQRQIGASASSYQNPYTRQQIPARYNKPQGTGMAFPPDSRVYNVGRMVSRTYSVNPVTAQLLVADNLTGAASQSIAEGIVALRAMYGKDTNGDGSIDVYDAVAPADWSTVIGIRLAVVARAGKREASMVTPATLSLWSPRAAASEGEEEEDDGPDDQGMSMSLSNEQRHYRYRMFQTLVPLRNTLWTIPETRG